MVGLDDLKDLFQRKQLYNSRTTVTPRWLEPAQDLEGLLWKNLVFASKKARLKIKNFKTKNTRKETQKYKKK